MPKPACLKCKCFYRPEKNGFRIIEGMPICDYNGENIRGNNKPECWKPYKVWEADLWECPECHHQLITGFGMRPLSEHYKDDFEKLSATAKVQINDC